MSSLKKYRDVFLLICYLSCVLNNISAQQASNISKKVENNILSSNNYLKTDHPLAFKYAKKAFDDSKNGTAEDKIKSTSNLISILLEQGKLPEVHSYLNFLYDIALKYNQQAGIYDYYLHKSSTLILEGFYKEARLAVDSAFSIAREHALKDTGILFFNLGLIDFETLRTKPGLIELKKAYDLSNNDISLMRLCMITQLPYSGVNTKSANAVLGLDTILSNLENENNLFMLGQAYNMLGNAYFLNFNFPLANKNFLIANQYFRKINSPFYQSSNNLAWVTTLSMQNKPDSALLLNNETLKIFEALNYKLGLSIAHMFASDFYRKLKDTANSRKHRELSEYYNKESKNPVIASNNMLTLAREEKSKNKGHADSIIVKATKIMKAYAKDYLRLINIQAGKDSSGTGVILKNLERLVNEIDFLNDSLTQKKNADALQELETKYKVRQKNDSLHIQQQQLQLKETEIELKETQKKNLRSGIFILSSIALLIGCLVFILFRQKKKIAREKRAVENLTGILKHETSRQFSDLKSSISQILKTEHPKQQVAKALSRVNINEMLYKNLFISGGLASISLKNAIGKIFEYHCGESDLAIKPTLEISGGQDIIFNKSDYLFHYMNELMANSFEHAFAGINNPAINVLIEYHKPFFIITYGDNGMGLSEEKKEIIPGKGLWYIHAYATQNLHGTIEINSNNGTEYKLTFHETNI